MATFELLVLVVGILVSLCASGFALLECSKLLRSVERYRHDVGILEDLYKEDRAEISDAYDRVEALTDIIDNTVDINTNILEHNKSVLEDVLRIRHDVSMLQVRLEDMNDSPET